MIFIEGGVAGAATHFAQYGLAAILTDAGAQRVRLGWRNEATARAFVTWQGELHVGETVLAHARRHTASSSWVTQTRPSNDVETGLFSPRIKAPNGLEAWRGWVGSRREFLDRMELTLLDRRMIGALGEPAHWQWAPKDFEPDHGASRWEMKTRNRGEEFVKNRLALLARAVSSWHASDVTAGIEGRQIQDDVGRNASGSRTSTGFAAPGPMDNALAWCTLWGIASWPPVPQARNQNHSQTPGVWPRNRVHPADACLPIFGCKTSLPKIVSLTRTREFDTAAFAPASDPEWNASRVWLRDHGVLALVRFPVTKTGSSSAPERTIRAGIVEGIV